MKKWLLILIIVLIVVGAFVLFALSSDFGSEITKKVASVFPGDSIPQPPALPE